MHALILGQTGSGKTTLATRLSQMYRRAGDGVLVFDPHLDPRWDCHYITSDPGEFLHVAQRSQGCMLMVDESAEAVSAADRDNWWLATRSRHNRHVAHFIAQRAAGSIARIVRDQCSSLFLFRSSLEDCKLHANEWADEALREAHQLRTFEYWHATRMGQGAVRCRIRV